MKTLWIIFATVLLGSFVYATQGPFPPWITKLTGDVTYSDAGAASYAAGSIVSADIATDTIVATDIAAGAVDTSELAASSVTATEIAASALTEADVITQAAEGLHIKRIARVTYDVAVDLGTIGAHTLGVSLPANALIQRSWLYIVTQFVDGGSGTVAISCEDANNIKTATDITGTADAGLIEGESTGATSAMKGSIAAACEVTATVAVADQTAGKAIIYIEYTVVE